MTPTEILEELSKLPATERLAILEAALREAREEMQPGNPTTELTERQVPPARERRSGSLDEVEGFRGFLLRIFRVFTG